MQSQPNAVESLDALLRNSGPHPSRTGSIKHWHLDQMTAADPAVAMLHIAITAGGRIIIKGLGLDHVHAAIVLDELRQVSQQIAGFLQEPPPHNVIPIR